MGVYMDVPGVRRCRMKECRGERLRCLKCSARVCRDG